MSEDVPQRRLPRQLCQSAENLNMGDSTTHKLTLPPEQEAIRAKCFHPGGVFVGFPIEDVETSIPARFEKIVRMYPDRLAVKDKDRSLTYTELNQVANRIARAIIDKCGRESEPIIVLADHGLSSIISCLGILKAGKIVVAIDPLSPQERIAYMLEDSGASVMVTETNNFSRAVALAKTAGQIIVDIDAVDIRLSNENLGSHILPDAPAQLRYTSGSTNQPKGVLRSHRRNLHSNMLTINAAQIGYQDRLLLLRNFSIGMKDILNGILTGAVLVPFDIRKNGFRGLTDLFNDEKITYYTSTPSTFRYFMNEVRGDQKFTSVRLIQLGGEPVSKREVDAFKKHFTEGCVLMNQLSSNEAGTLCQYIIKTDTDISTPIVPVGYPVDGKKISLVDEDGREVDQGEVGEIVVRSLYLSSGYWRHPELTVSKFDDDPDSKHGRVYLTGDFGRWLPDGRLVYLGRKDDQIKIRGYKVSLREIEFLLLEHSHVNDAVVVAWDRENGDKYLAAYCVSPGNNGPRVDELRGFLKRKIPDYMVPSVFIYLDALPITNGKLDRKALPKPDENRPHISTQYVAPRSEIEQKLVEIWQKILTIRPIGIHDNFFDLGGHSLAAMLVVSQVIQNFQVELPIQSLFQSPTVAEMATVIREHQGKKLDAGELDRILNELELMSDEDAQQLMAKERSMG